VSQPPFLIYIVDDDEDDLLFIQDAFSAIGLEDVLKGFFNGNDLIQYIRFTENERSPNMIILDYQMPLLTGKELLFQVRTFPHLSKVPIIFYSDKINNEVEKELINAGALSCIKKGLTQKDQVQFVKYISEFLKKD
jgi:CheY-like chemotaxis protein